MLRSNFTTINVNQIAGLNTLGISLLRAARILLVLDGELYVVFITSNINNVGNKLFTKTLKKGNVFMFPKGIHFQFNCGYGNVVAIAALKSQNPGVITIANAMFRSKLPISDDVLAKALQEDKKTVDWLQAQF